MVAVVGVFGRSVVVGGVWVSSLVGFGLVIWGQRLGGVLVGFRWCLMVWCLLVCLLSACGFCVDFPLLFCGFLCIWCCRGGGLLP